MRMSHMSRYALHSRIDIPMTLYRTATRTELDQILGWAADEGWNPGQDDATPFYSADPQGFFVAERDGRIVAAISVVNHSDDFAFLGLYIVTPDCRGQGVGYALWRYALDHAGPRSIGLDGVAEQQDNYAGSGFVKVSRTIRYSGFIPPQLDNGITVAGPEMTEDLIAREAAASGAIKRRFLQNWFKETSTRRTLYCTGTGAFCTVRACVGTAKIGPLVAEHPVDAKRLMQHAAHVFGPELVIDVPAGSPQLIAICNGFSMQAGFETARMYRGLFEHTAPDLFAAATLELG